MKTENKIKSRNELPRGYRVFMKVLLKNGLDNLSED